MLCTVQLEVTRADHPTPWIYTVDLIVPENAYGRADLDRLCEMQAREMAGLEGMKVLRLVATELSG